MIKTIAKRSISILAALAIIISGLFAVSFDEVSAVSAPGQVMSIKATGITAYEATIHWGGATGLVKGYTVFRNGKALKHVGANVRSYKDTSVKASAQYTYYVKAYTFTGKKIKQWYNTKTKKWQITMPPMRIRGTSRFINEKKYGKASPSLNFKTQKATVIHGRVVKPSEFTAKNNYTISYTKKGTTCATCKVGQTVTVTYNPKERSYKIKLKGKDNSKTCHNPKCKKYVP